MSIVGGWKINVTVDAMPEKVATAFAELNEKMVGAEYTPIAYLGSQLVNGTNHAVLAEQVLTTGRDVKNVVLVIFNEKDMNCTLVNIEREVESGVGMGGTVVDVKTDIPAEAKVEFTKAFKDWTGSEVKPFALLGTQVVEGIDYIFAAEVDLVVAEPVKKIAIVTVNNLVNTVSFKDVL